jgi:4-hydroxy-3-methylbut-2-enyl diphosphate reductase
LVDDASRIDPEWLAEVNTVGLTSGASVPEDLVAGVVDWLATRGFTDLEEVTTVEERMTFSLPRDLTRDLRAAGQEPGRA